MAFWATRGGGRRRSEHEPAGEPDEIVDLRDEPLVRPVDPVVAAEMRARFRSQAARAEAQQELDRLRARHWSGERIIEEARAEVEWWEHPDADPYAVLGLVPGASIEEAGSVRRRIAQDCHPDRFTEQTVMAELARRRMVAANQAYDRLRRALHAT